MTDILNTYNQINDQYSKVLGNLSTAASKTESFINGSGLSDAVKGLGDLGGDVEKALKEAGVDVKAIAGDIGKLTDALGQIGKLAALVGPWASVVTSLLSGLFGGSQNNDDTLRAINKLFSDIVTALHVVDAHQTTIQIDNHLTDSKAALKNLQAEASSVSDAAGATELRIQTMRDALNALIALTQDNVDNTLFQAIYTQQSQFHGIKPNPEPGEGQPAYEFRHALPALCQVAINFITCLLACEPAFRSNEGRMSTLNDVYTALLGHYQNIAGRVVTPWTLPPVIGISDPGNEAAPGGNIWKGDPLVGAVEPLTGMARTCKFSDLGAVPVPPDANVGASSVWKLATSNRRKLLAHDLGLTDLARTIHSYQAILGVAPPDLGDLLTWSVRQDILPLAAVGDLVPPPGGFRDTRGRVRIGPVLRAVYDPKNVPGAGISVRQVLTAF